MFEKQQQTGEKSFSRSSRFKIHVFIAGTNEFALPSTEKKKSKTFLTRNRCYADLRIDVIPKM